MKTLLSFLFLLLAATVSAQKGIAADPSTLRSLPPSAPPIGDSIRAVIRERLNNTRVPDTLGKNAPVNNMPNAIRYRSFPPVLKGNNGRGFDVYESPLDRMPILMPDSVNRSLLKRERP